MPQLFEEKYFNAIRPYMPEEARAALDSQVPVIRQQVAEQIEAFSQSLKDEMVKEIEAFSADQVAELHALSESVGKMLTQIENTTDTAKLTNQAAALRSEVEAFRDRNRKFGEGIRKVALSAAKSVGLPIA